MGPREGRSPSRASEARSAADAVAAAGFGFVEALVGALDDRRGVAQLGIDGGDAHRDGERDARVLELELGALDDQMKRALYLKEESIKKSLETEAGLNDFHERPEINPIFKRIQRVKREREDYARRLEHGHVKDEEQRDRTMGEQKLTFTELPIMGAIIARVARFGTLSYFQLRDLERKESLLSYDPRLDPLRNCVFDVYSVAGSVAAKLKRNDNGTAFRVADHFKACWRNQDKAEELYGQHRAALREDRGLAPMDPRNEAEAEIIERLVSLAAAVDGGGSTGVPGAPG